jgi:hypothetical protein
VVPVRLHEAVGEVEHGGAVLARVAALARAVRRQVAPRRLAPVEQAHVHVPRDVREGVAVGAHGEVVEVLVDAQPGLVVDVLPPHQLAREAGHALGVGRLQGGGRGQEEEEEEEEDGEENEEAGRK